MPEEPSRPTLDRRRRVVLAVLAVVAVSFGVLSRVTDSSGPSGPGPESSVAPVVTGPLVTEGAAGPSSSLAPAAGSPGVNSANRLILWSGVRECSKMTDAQIDRWATLGVSGFICRGIVLSGMGSGNDRVTEWTGDPGADLGAPAYETQRAFLASAMVRRARAGSLKVYLGFYTLNRNDTRTHLSEWFDDAGWSGLTLPKVADIAGAARIMGFAGIFMDLEQYGGTGSWNWNYTGVSQPEAAVRAKARQRGAQLMEAVLRAFPGAEVLAYGTKFPDTWDAVVQSSYNGPSFAKSVQPEFWDGITGVPGYKAIRFTGELFYKNAYPTDNWDDALRYWQNGMQAFASRTWRNWDYASTRFFQTPSAWIDGGDGRAVKPAAYVADQLAQFRKWGDGGEFYIYAYNPLESFDYTPFRSGLQAATKPGTVDTEAPRLSAGATAKAGGRVALGGTAKDNLAIRRVTWSTDGGATGVARMTWQPAEERMDWTVDDVPDRGGGTTRVTVTAEDIKGLAHSTELTLAPSGGA